MTRLGYTAHCKTIWIKFAIGRRHQIRRFSEGVLVVMEKQREAKRTVQFDSICHYPGKLPIPPSFSRLDEMLTR